MIGVTKLLCGQSAQGDGLRYRWRRASHGDGLGAALARRPIVVWNSTKACNLRCITATTPPTQATA